MKKEEITNLINATIKDNDSGLITAEVMRNVLNAINEGTGDGYTYIGTATPSTTPITLTGGEKVFYVATEGGDYSNFGLGNISQLSVIKSESGSWKAEGLGVSLDIIVTPKQTTFFKKREHANLFNPKASGIVKGKYLYSDGRELSASTYIISDYIEFTKDMGSLVSSMKSAESNYQMAGINSGYACAYDKNKNFTHSVSLVSNSVITWQEGDAYARFSFARMVNDDNTNQLQIEEGDVFSQLYYPYRQPYIFDNEYLDFQYEIPDKSVTTKKLEDKFEAKYSPNLLDLSKCQLNKYAKIHATSGLVFSDSAVQMCSDYIKVKPNTEYCWTYGNSYIPFDSNKVPLISEGYTVSVGNSFITTPDNCEYIIINLYMTRDSVMPFDFTRSSRVYEGNTLYPYTPYGITTGKTFQVYKHNQLISSLGGDGMTISSSDLTSKLSFEKKAYPSALKKNQISFSAKVQDFNSGIRIGRGFVAYNSGYFEISSSKITLYRYETPSVIHNIQEENHNLNIEDYIKIVISERGDKALVVIQTLSDVYYKEFEYRDFNGAVSAESMGATLTDCKLSVSNASLKSPVWMFGDSYYGSSGDSRQMYWLKKWGILNNCLIQGYGGQNSVNAFYDLEKCIALGFCPNYLVWSLGMNDDNSSDLADITTGLWYQNYIKVKQLCELNGITLVLTTIPEVRSSSYRNKDKMSEIIRNSGLRYIDAAKAVGSDENGNWYGNGTDYDYQSSDNVHPSRYGASAIATQFLTDFPELMQYS